MCDRGVISICSTSSLIKVNARLVPRLGRLAGTSSTPAIIGGDLPKLLGGFLEVMGGGFECSVPHKSSV